MTEHRKKRKAAEVQASPAGAAKKKRDFKIIPGTVEGEPTERKPPRIRVVGQDERLTPDERKFRFAHNFDRLIGLIGLSRKEVAGEIGLTHKLILRLVSSGVSRTDDRNIDSLTRIAAYFALPNVDDLWRADLIHRLLFAQDSGFVQKFQPRLLAERERRLAEIQTGSEDELALVSRALGFESATQTLTGPYAEKVGAILASPKANQFKRLIDDYFQLSLVVGSVDGHNERG